MDSTKTRTSRRNFLLAAGVSGAATVAAIAAKTAHQDTGKADEKKETASAGYTLSEHVRNYYRTTLV
jgi:hypothetical protein